MKNLIIKKVEQLPTNLQSLIDHRFIASKHPEICYVPSFINFQGIAKIPYYICAVMSSITGLLFLGTGISEMMNWIKNKQFKNEGVFITFMMFAFMFSLFLLCRRNLKKSKLHQQKMNSGEVKYGLWITPTHLLIHFMNGGLECIEKKDIAHLEIYNSGRPRIDMVVVRLHNKQVIRIVSDWLVGYYKKVEDLRLLIEKNSLKA